MLRFFLLLKLYWFFISFSIENVNQKGFLSKLLTLLTSKGYPKNDLKMEVYKIKMEVFMKSKQVFYLRMFLINVSIGLTFFSVNAIQAHTFDPMIDFRAPYSLTELMHEGLISIESILHDCSGDDMAPSLSRCSSELARLNSSYDEMINRSKIDTVYRDDREFLQRLIDRIDSMIHNLEGSPDLSQEDQALLSENSEQIRSLKERV